MRRLFVVLWMVFFAPTVALAGPDSADWEKFGTDHAGKAILTHEFTHGHKLEISLLGDSNKDDANRYGIRLKTALGLLDVMPQVVFTADRSLAWNQNDDTRKTSEFTLALNGEKGILEFEGEFAYQNVDYSGIVGHKEADIFGIYGNLWTNLDAGEIGLLFAYGDRNDGKEGFRFGNDFDGAIFLGETVPTFRNTGILKPAGSPHHGIAVTTLAQVYARMAIGDKLNVKPSLTYFADNLKNFSAGAYEVNLSAGYKITDTMTYKAAVAFSKVDAKAAAADGIDAEDIDGMSFLQKLVLDF